MEYIKRIYFSLSEYENNVLSEALDLIGNMQLVADGEAVGDILYEIKEKFEYLYDEGVIK